MVGFLVGVVVRTTLVVCWCATQVEMIHSQQARAMHVSFPSPLAPKAVGGWVERNKAKTQLELR